MMIAIQSLTGAKRRDAMSVDNPIYHCTTTLKEH